jgi:hypothetical protein
MWVHMHALTSPLAHLLSSSPHHLSSTELHIWLEHHGLVATHNRSYLKS